MDVSDLPLFRHATIRTDALGSATELRSILDRLERRDAYRLSESDRTALFDEFD